MEFLIAIHIHPEVVDQTYDLWWSLLGLVVGWAGGFSLGYYVGRKKK